MLYEKHADIENDISRVTNFLAGQHPQNYYEKLESIFYFSTPKAFFDMVEEVKNEINLCVNINSSHI